MSITCCCLNALAIRDRGYCRDYAQLLASGLALALGVELAADILNTAAAFTGTAIEKLAAIATRRTALQFSWKGAAARGQAVATEGRKHYDWTGPKKMN